MSFSKNHARNTGSHANESPYNNRIPPPGEWTGGALEPYLDVHAFDVSKRGPQWLGLLPSDASQQQTASRRPLLGLLHSLPLLLPVAASRLSILPLPLPILPFSYPSCFIACVCAQRFNKLIKTQRLVITTFIPSFLHGRDVGCHRQSTAGKDWPDRVASMPFYLLSMDTCPIYLNDSSNFKRASSNLIEPGAVNFQVARAFHFQKQNTEWLTDEVYGSQIVFLDKILFEFWSPKIYPKINHDPGYFYFKMWQSHTQTFNFR
jgi:hypothetical protein